MRVAPIKPWWSVVWGGVVHVRCAVCVLHMPAAAERPCVSGRDRDRYRTRCSFICMLRFGESVDAELGPGDTLVLVASTMAAAARLAMVPAS